VIEDILRIYGYNNVEIPMQVNSRLTYSQNQLNDRIFNIAADMLTANGFHEIMSNSLTKSGYYEGLTSYPAENCVKIMNPLSSDLNVMRQTLLFNALEAAALNINHKRSDLKLYEFGNCYFYDNAKKEEGGLAPYSETYTLGILVSGQTNEASWNIKTAQSDFYTLKVYAEKLLARFGVNINNAQIDPLESDLYREAVRFTFNNKKLFDIGIVAKKIRNIFDIKQEVYFLEMDFDRLIKLAPNVKIGAKELSKYPEVRRDLALLVDKSVTFRQLRDLAFKTERKLLKKVGLFDVYEGDKLPEGKKSYALNFVLEDTTKTMTDTIIEKVMSSLIAQFEAQLGAKIR
jgi:phenylalanyl-tRNA synthetase beta chain